MKHTAIICKNSISYFRFIENFETHSFNFTRISCIEDTRGKVFSGYIMLKDAINIPDLPNIFETVKNRTR